MSTEKTQLPNASSTVEPSHTYHAEATALTGKITHPIQQTINPQAHAKLEGKHEGYLSQQSEAFRVEQVIMYRSAYAQVAGHHAAQAGKGFDPTKTFRESPKVDGWRTLSTSVIEGLNILNVLTAERIVSQVSTVHPKAGHLPTISFLGTHFDNLRLAGKEIKLTLDLDILGEKPVVANRKTRIGIPEGACPLLEDHFGRLASLQKQEPKTNVNSGERVDVMYGSLVTSIQVGDAPVTQGPMIDLPDFGKIYFAPFKLTQSDFKDGQPHRTHLDIKMLAVRMGCIADGDADARNSVVGGITEP